MEHVKTYFETYPEKNEVFETSDGFLFHKDTDAKNHSVTLKDKDVTPHKRKDFVKQPIDEKPTKTAEEIAAEKEAAKSEKAAAKAAAKLKKETEGTEGENPGAGEGDNAGE